MLFSTAANYRIAVVGGNARSVYVVVCYSAAIASIWCWPQQLLPWQLWLQVLLSTVLVLRMPALWRKPCADGGDHRDHRDPKQPQASATSRHPELDTAAQPELRFMVSSSGRWTWLSQLTSLEHYQAHPSLWQTLTWRWLPSVWQWSLAVGKSGTTSFNHGCNPSIPWQVSPRSRVTRWVLWLHLIPAVAVKPELAGRGWKTLLTSRSDHRASQWLWIFRDQVSERDFRRLARCVNYQQQRPVPSPP